MKSPAHRPRLAPMIALGLGLVAGCDQPTGSTMPRPRAKVALVAEAPEPPPAPEPPRVPILGKKTQDIREDRPENTAGSVEVKPKITAKDPITLTGNAYVVAIGKTALGNIQHALDLYQAEHGEYPKTHDEFMEKIIKPGIALPRLPSYQEYFYNPQEHRLLIREYPDRR